MRPFKVNVNKELQGVKQFSWYQLCLSILWIWYMQGVQWLKIHSEIPDILTITQIRIVFLRFLFHIVSFAAVCRLVTQRSSHKRLLSFEPHSFPLFDQSEFGFHIQKLFALLGNGQSQCVSYLCNLHVCRLLSASSLHSLFVRWIIALKTSSNSLLIF